MEVRSGSAAALPPLSDDLRLLLLPDDEEVAVAVWLRLKNGEEGTDRVGDDEVGDDEEWP